MDDRIHLIPPADRSAAGLPRHLQAHPEIRFVSLAGVDLGGNDTDEKIPATHFLADIEEYLMGASRPTDRASSSRASPPSTTARWTSSPIRA